MTSAPVDLFQCIMNRNATIEMKWSKSIAGAEMKEHITLDAAEFKSNEKIKTSKKFCSKMHLLTLK